ncbi:MAG: acyltransferase [Variovorax sp.]|jgi:peptidoglycan/LPS O-acetylase OafA/YrhL|nr:acyltransferase [Variovorax sp.]
MASGAGRDRIPLIDLMRLMAAMAVMVFHYGFLGGVNNGIIDVYSPELGEFAKYGYLGVDIFFVISGLVIAWSAEGSGAAPFAWKRFLRIYPTFVFSAAVTALVIYLANDPNFSVSWLQVLAHLFVDSRRVGEPLLDGSYWTIVFEVIFYVMVTVCLSFPALRRRADALLWLWLGVSILNAFVLHTRALSYFAIADYAGLFVCGIAIYRLHRGRTTFGNIALLVVALCYVADRALVSANTRFDAAGVDWSPAVVLMILAAGVLLIYASLRIRTGKRTGRFLKQCGALTYPLYLLHGTIGAILINRLSRNFSLEVSLFVASFIVLMLSLVVANVVEPRLKTAFVAMRDQAMRCR